MSDSQKSVAKHLGETNILLLCIVFALGLGNCLALSTIDGNDSDAELRQIESTLNNINTTLKTHRCQP